MTDLASERALPDHVSVVVVGAGLSGIGAAYRLQTECPERDYVVLEGRESMGGTWDLFRYPGVRSDSDIFSFAFTFRPWVGDQSLADGPSILRYVEETAAEFGIDQHIRYGARVVAADFDTTTAQWTLTLTTPSGEHRLTCDFVIGANGYYSYDRPHDPELPGIGDFAGEVVHPQSWPEDLDWTGKRVVVVGSGATAVTLVPAMAERAEHVTMLQRTPTYLAAVPRRDRVAAALQRRLPAGAAYRLTRSKNLLLTTAHVGFLRRFPEQGKRALASGVAESAGPDWVDPHFTPPYDPWEQRLCAVPGGDLFTSLRRGDASVVTGTIETFTPGGVRLTSGEELAADIVVTATGLRLLVDGGIALSVDGEAVDLGEQWVWKGAMITGLPNLARIIGYAQGFSWTLRADITNVLACRILNLMRERDLAYVVPDPAQPLPRLPLLDLSSGYITRAAGTIPSQGGRWPWTVTQSYLLDRLRTLHSPLTQELRLVPRSDLPHPEKESPMSATDSDRPMASWQPDLLGEGYEQLTYELGPDPDGEGEVCAVLVRRGVRTDEQVRGAVLYVHGYSDYFFQTEMADFFAAQGLAFYGIDLRKSGRARREGQTPHYVSDLTHSDRELDLAVAEMAAEHPGLPVVVVAHSTGGLITALWLDRRRARDEVAPVVGLIHNSPWYDLQGSALQRGPVTQALRLASKATPFRTIPGGLGVYGRTLHVTGTGEWDFDTTYKPLDGFPATVGWLNAIRRGHARLHRGLDVGVPALVLRSERTHYAPDYSETSDLADLVLDVRHIQKWAGCLGREVLVKPIPGARHDVFLSRKEVRDEAYAVTERWLREHLDGV